MHSTAIRVSPEMKKRLGVGHDAALSPTPDFDVPVFPAAGSFRSTANDLLTFLAACLGDTQSSLTPALAAMLETHRPNQLWGMDQGLGWFILGRGDSRIILGGGATYGYGCTIAYDPKARVGVVVLANTANGEEGIAMHLLRPKNNPLPNGQKAVAQKRKEIAVDPQVFDRYAGNYEPSPGSVFTVLREKDALRIMLPSAPKLRLFPEAEREFFVKENDYLRVSFKTDDKGHATSLILHLGQLSIPAKRMK
jgi:CubicO group peptidase (beta-lactamase class C family)